jgi:hypothetical protein
MHVGNYEKHKKIKIDTENIYNDIQNQDSSNHNEKIEFFKSFPYAFLKVFFKDDTEVDNETIEMALDNLGSNDYGIDAYYLDDTTKTFYFFQFKTTQNYDAKCYSRKDLEDFKGLQERLIKAHNNNNHKNYRVKSIIAEINNPEYQSYEKKFYFVYTSNCKDEELKNYEGIDFYNLDRIYNLFCEYDNLQKDTWPEQCPIEFVYTHKTKQENEENYNKQFSLWYQPGKRDICIGVINGKSIVKLMKEHSYSLFDRNVRYFLGANKINSAIQNTAQNNPEDFFYYNNGITITCTKFVKKGGREIILEYPQVINGAQTLNSIYEIYKDNPDDSNLAKILLLTTIITSPKDDDHNFTKNLTKYRNTNNSVKFSDYKGNAKEQEYLQKKFYDFNYFYEIKRGEFDRFVKKRSLYRDEKHNTIENYQNKPEFKTQNITMEKLAKIWCAYKVQDPRLSKMYPKSIFSNDDIYKDVFPSQNVAVEYANNTIKEIIFAMKIYWHLNYIQKISSRLFQDGKNKKLNESEEEKKSKEEILERVFDSKYKDYAKSNNQDNAEALHQYHEYLSNSELHILALIKHIMDFEGYTNINDYYDSSSSINSLNAWVYQILKLINKAYEKNNSKKPQSFINYAKSDKFYKDMKAEFKDLDNDDRNKFILK